MSISPESRTSNSSRSRSHVRTVQRVIGRVANAALSLVFPPRCAFCEVSLDVESIEPQLCRECTYQIFTPKKSACPRCGAYDFSDNSEHKSPMKASCSECKRRKFTFDRVVSLGVYADKLQAAVLRMKYGPGQPLAMAVGKRLGDLLEFSDDDGQPDLITCIPKYWLKRLLTGVNSAETIMCGLGKSCGIAFAPDLLVCERRIKKQSLLLPDQRSRNVKSAWSVNKNFDVQEAHVMVVDDTMTTGATANEAAKALKRAGCSQVTVAVVGRAVQLM